MAYESLLDEIVNEFQRHAYVYDAGILNQEAQERFKRLMLRQATPTEYAKALGLLSASLEKYHGRKTIILLDEYDVPLENAYYARFYDEMSAFIRPLCESALKTSDSLYFAVITGCLRISKESIFTGLNYLHVISILDKSFSEYFGFTQPEVETILHDYGVAHRLADVRQWYDGYVFGETEVYNPWSVISFVDKLLRDEKAYPTAAWANSSANSIIRDLIYRADDVIRDEIQALMDGKTIEKQIHEDITYDKIYDTEDNLWNFLYFTGYLKAVSIRYEQPHLYAALRIPNTEVLTIYTDHISRWFKDRIKTADLSVLYRALTNGDADTLQAEIGRLLIGTISYMDHAESFYHGFMLGILAHIQGYGLKSNREAGTGRYDIAVCSQDISKRPIILELKTAGRFRDMDKAADTALQQIRDRRYAICFAEDGYRE